MFDNFRKIIGRSYTPLNLIEISGAKILGNYKYLSTINREIAIAPVLKSNAYGHGIFQVGKILEKTNAPFYCVDSLYEAYQLFRERIGKPILIMGYIDPSNLRVKRLPFSYAVSSLEQLESVNRFQQGASVHLKVDTGMHRAGIGIEDFSEFVQKALTFKNVKIDGLMSHFAQAGSLNNLTKKQIANFVKATEIITSNGINPAWKHISATDGLLNLPKEISKISNLARVGLGMYGIDGSGRNPGLELVLKLTTKIVQVKELKAGDCVGYNSTFVAKPKMLVGILPIGYNDGVDRRLSNKGFVKIGDRFCQIVGMVSMNITTVDLSGLVDVSVGQEAVVYSDEPDDVNSILSSANTCATIPYELLIHLSPTSIKRLIV